MRVHVWFGAGRLLIPLKDDETVAWLCSETSRRLTRRLGKETRVEGLRLPSAADNTLVLDPSLTVKSVVEDGGDLVAVFSGDPAPAPAPAPAPQHTASAAATGTAVCVQCGSTFNVAEEEECERLGKHPADPARLCRFHAQPPVKHLWSVRYTCCNSGGDRDVPCRGGFHRAQHHTDYPYAAFVPYAAQLMSEVECVWYERERVDLADGTAKRVRVARLSGRRVLVAVTARREQLPRVAVVGGGDAEDAQRKQPAASFVLLKVLDAAQFIEQPVEWHDRANDACWLRLSAAKDTASAALWLVEAVWKCASDNKPTKATFAVDSSTLELASTATEEDGGAQCALECRFAGGFCQQQDEKACTETIPEETAQQEAGEAPALAEVECGCGVRVSQVGAVVAEQDPDVLKGAMGQRFTVRVRVANTRETSATLSRLAATVFAASGRSLEASNVAVGLVGADGAPVWLEEALPVVVAAHDSFGLVLSAKVALPGCKPGHDAVTRHRAHPSLGSRVGVDFALSFTAAEATEAEQAVLHAAFVNPALVLPSREQSAAVAARLAQDQYPTARLVDWCSCDDVETLWRHFVAVYDASSTPGEHKLLVHLSEQHDREFFVLDKEFYQHALLVCDRCTLDSTSNCREVPVARNDNTSVVLLITADTHCVAALRIAIDAKTDKPASCTHYYFIGA